MSESCVARFCPYVLINNTSSIMSCILVPFKNLNILLVELVCSCADPLEKIGILLTSSSAYFIWPIGDCPVSPGLAMMSLSPTSFFA